MGHAGAAPCHLGNSGDGNGAAVLPGSEGTRAIGVGSTPAAEAGNGGNTATSPVSKETANDADSERAKRTAKPPRNSARGLGHRAATYVSWMRKVKVKSVTSQARQGMPKGSFPLRPPLAAGKTPIGRWAKVWAWQT